VKVLFQQIRVKIRHWGEGGGGSTKRGKGGFLKEIGKFGGELDSGLFLSAYRTYGGMGTELTCHCVTGRRAGVLKVFRIEAGVLLPAWEKESDPQGGPGKKLRYQTPPHHSSCRNARKVLGPNGGKGEESRTSANPPGKGELEGQGGWGPFQRDRGVS